MKQYTDLLNLIVDSGLSKSDRTGVGTSSIFGHQMRFNLRHGFPLLTTKYTHFPAIVHELLWFLTGSTNIQYLKDNNVRIWNEWATEEGEVGNMYGAKWVNWPNHKGGEPINQIKQLVNTLKTNPNSRRMVVSAWDPADLPVDGLNPIENVLAGNPALASCHSFFQCVVEDGQLSMMLYMRSSDVFLGLPFNIAGYALLTHMLAHVCGLQVGDLVVTTGDTHIYNNHMELIDELLSREEYPLPTLMLHPDVTDIFNFGYDDIKLVNYQYHPAIKAAVAV